MQTFKYYKCLHDDIYVTFYLLFYDIFLPISYDSSKRCKNAFNYSGMNSWTLAGSNMDFHACSTKISVLFSIFVFLLSFLLRLRLNHRSDRRQHNLPIPRIKIPVHLHQVKIFINFLINLHLSFQVPLHLRPS